MDLHKRAAILKAAKKLFVVGGLQGASMEAIANLAQVSKVTLYSHFSNKDALFQEAVGEACRNHSPDEAYLDSTSGSLVERLTRIAEGFFGLISSAEALSLYRLMASNPTRHRILARLFWDAGPEATMQRFALLLSTATANGELRVDDPRAAAAHFFFLVQGELHMKLIIGTITRATAQQQRREHIDGAVGAFIRAYAAD